MIKRSAAVFLCVIMLLTGCNGNTDKNTPSENHQETTNNADEPVLAEPVINEPVVNDPQLVWKDLSDYSNETVPFSPTRYSAKVPSYQVTPNLGNVENIHRFNGFSKEQIQKLVNNGFVVLDPNPDTAYLYMKMYNIYETNEYTEIPNFITVDAALHLYHKFFDETLKGIEKEQLFQALQQLTENMLHKAEYMYSDDANLEVKEELEHIVVYFSVANKLISDSYGEIPTELISIAKKEIEEIEKAEGYVKSPLFHFDINYEQFIVRGHYAGDETMEKYFKTMMWFGLTGYPFQDDQGNWDNESITKALLITYISFLEDARIDDIALWDKIYAPTNFFVGQSDDITLFNLKEVIIKVYGKDVIPTAFKNEAYYVKLIEEINKLPEPQIKNKLITGMVDTPTGKQFRFMGQRYTLDANIMQELMFPIIRPVPTGLDVAGAFGNERAETLAKESYLKDLEPEKYSKSLQKMKDKVQSLKQADWQQNLYNGWLWVLESVWSKKEKLEGLPLFMQNQTWHDKNIQTGLGSYAELKHDTVLYAKQPVAEMGGGEEPQDDLPNYVEPAVEVYDKLLWLVRYSKSNLEKRGLLSDRSAYALNELERIYELFRSCSVKELENIPLSEEENNSLRYIGGAMEHIDSSLSEEYSKTISSAVISDVAGIADFGLFLEVGTGLPNDIYVILHNKGRTYMARGVVYSYYEFLSSKPFTDQQWHETLGIERIEDGDWHYDKINPELLLKNTPPQPNWIGTFKSFEENRVNITPVEYSVGQ